MADTPITDLLKESIGKLREIVDANVVIGTPITLSEDVTIVPITKIAIGLACGGSDFGKDSANIKFGGGAGSGVTVTPVSFVVCEKGSVRMISCEAFQGNPYAQTVEAVPVAVKKISEMVEELTDRLKKKQEKE